ncbi:hypothetical protein H3Z83_12595 [Tenacibaculum sp. S7007]|uniref:Uncharacterized protein n=1 Tax=Tenacibaculum pelagium TaxID=2759527 RepID=A0A839ASN4_9FLAO|nr:hypothetical protein [Tenacibaculum pelagium]MBA6157348.1 hypothetical protein [Tenacibaculum pelagium]
MKKNISLLLLSIFFFTKLYGQNAYKKEQSYYGIDVEAKYFAPVKIYLANDSIINGYGSLHGTNMTSIKFTKDPGSNKYANTWAIYPTEEIFKVELGSSDKKVVLHTLQMPKIHGFVALEYKNNSVSLYSHLAVYGKIYVIKKHNEAESHFLWLHPKKKKKSIRKKYAKIFSDCNDLKEKMINGEYKNTYEDLIMLLDYYDNCSKTN